jgi:glyoxylase-like metal-dependent hydrolase (beta-lactamase superfamily II)
MDYARKVNSDVDILPSSLPLPGMGIIPVNAFVLHAEQPVLIDSGLHQDHDQFMAELESVIDPTDLKWLWLTHPDQDHIGSLHTLVERFPNIRVVTTYLGFGILGLFKPLPPDRVYFLNPGQHLDVGDRTLVCLRPPTFDSPATTSLFDTKSRSLFSSDSFGALLQDAPPEEAYSIPANDLRDGQLLWATVDAPWLHKVDPSRFAETLNEIRALDPAVVLSAHLPPARAMLPRLLDTLSVLPGAAPFAGPDQAAFEALLNPILHAVPA